MDPAAALPPEARTARAAMQLAEADGAFQAGDLATAQVAYEAAAADYRALGQNGPLADCLHQLGVLRQYAGAYAEAEPLLQESARLADVTGNSAALARTLHQLGRSRLQSGDYSGADDYYAQSLALKTTLGDRSGMAGTLHQMGMLRRLQGNHKEAEDYYGLALAINQRLSDWPGVGGTLAELGRLRLDEGDYTAAIANSWQALSIFHGSSRPEAAYAALTILQARHAMDPAAFATAAEHAGLTREVIAEVEAAAQT
ncbi:MAG: tetratricopeptide repeat protein [Chloroflexota bacterium]|nr:tetratricopeptide repeat protein [Chloroflexota bacterium]